MNKRMLLALLFGLFIAGLTAAQGKLLAGNLDVEDNSLEFLVGDDGIIAFLETVDHPGVNTIITKGMDVTPLPWMAHGPGVITTQLIKRIGEHDWEVASNHTFPARITIMKDAIVLDLGDETYRISKPKNYLIDIRPKNNPGPADTPRRFAYVVSKNTEKEKGFIGIMEKSYIPFSEFGKTPRIDWLAITYPKVLTFGEGRIQSYVYEMAGAYPDSASFSFDYQVTFSKDKQVNLQNYLILMTQRADNPGLFIHPVLLTLLYYDALMN